MVPKRPYTELLAALDETSISYCHWKSNNLLHEALDRGEELDLLVAPGNAGRFFALIDDLGFRPAEDSPGETNPSVFH